MSEYATRDIDPNLNPNLEAGREVPPDVGPLIQICDLHGGYVLALLSQAQDPLGNHLAERCKVRQILAADRSGLGGQIATVLVSEYGLTPEEADAMIPPELVTPAQEQARKQAEETRQHEESQAQAQAVAAGGGSQGFGWQDPQPEVSAERARDEHGRYV